MSTELLDGVVHHMPQDLESALISSPKAVAAWQAITPLARNEWLCWIESAKKSETRAHRIERTQAELAEGKRRPCCWMGCIHRTDKAVSPSVRAILSRQAKAGRSGV